MTAQQSLDFARARIGYYAPNDPQPGSEAGRWMARKTGQAWLAGPSPKVWWCMCFASMCTYEGGGTLPGGVSYNTDTTANAARKAGQLVSVASAQPGDLAIFDWRWATAATDHVGIVESNPRNGTLVCIEGNTSSGSAGSQSAGNGVWRRTRSTGYVRYVVRPTWPKATTGTPTQPASQYLTKADVRAMQEQIGTPADGEIWGQEPAWRARLWGISPDVIKYGTGGSKLVEKMQKRLGVDPDGVLGPVSIGAYQTWLGVAPDQWWGLDTSRATKAAIKEGRFKAWR